MPPSPTRLLEARFTATSVGRSVDYRVLLPSDRSAGEPLPFVLHLHGAMSSSASLELARPFYDELIAAGEFPRAIIACPSTPTVGGFYIDRPEAGWETLVAQEFPGYLEATHGPFTTTALVGASMGGYGALKLAFDAPERYAAVAAISPAVFPGETPTGVPGRNIPSVLGELHAAMSGGSGDADAYARDSVYGRARAHATRLRATDLPLLIDCGAADEYLLHEGAAYLHAVLDELEIRHEYRLVEGAGHLGPEAETRTADALRFLGRALGGASSSAVGALDRETGGPDVLADRGA